MNLLSKEKLKLKALNYSLKLFLAIPTTVLCGPAIAAVIFLYREFRSLGVEKITDEQKKSLSLKKRIAGQKAICLQASKDDPVNIALEDICKKMNEEKPALFITFGGLANLYPFEHIELGGDIVDKGPKFYLPVLAHEMQHQNRQIKLLNARRFLI